MAPAASFHAAARLLLLSAQETLAFTWERLLGIVLFVLCLPVMGVLGLMIFLQDRRTILFQQVRVGYADRPYGSPIFHLCKFRSMIPDAEARVDEVRTPRNTRDGVRFKERNDPRITPVGRLLRRFSLDELPQLWNVVRGDMDLVGPRPPLPAEVALYQLRDRGRLHGRPGITGPWQVAGRSEIGFQEQVEMDIAFLARRTWWRNLMLLLRTVPAVIGGRGAW